MHCAFQSKPMFYRMLFYGQIAGFTIIIALHTSCTDAVKSYYEKMYTSEMYVHSGYKLDASDRSFRLPQSLVEISGLSCVNDTHLVAVQDENGILYVINIENGNIERELKFGKKGDYEGVEYVDGKIYVLKSDGSVFHFKYPEAAIEEIKVKKIETPLSKKNDVEGLGYDPLNHALLFACKADGNLGRDKRKGRSVFTYDLKRKIFKKKPLYVVSIKKIKEFASENNIKLPKNVNFRPSAIALHPLTNRIYLLAHTGKSLLVLNREGDIVEYYRLNPSIFRQPEGICFSSDGTLYISNEGRGQPANILIFSYSR